MIMPRLTLSAAPLILTLSLIEPATSYACSAYQCQNDQFLPRDGSVPANIAAIAWFPGYDVGQGAESTTSLPRFECTAADGSKHEVSFIALPEDKPDHLQLSEPLVAGEHCTISSGVSDCSIEDPDFTDKAFLSGHADFDVTDASEIPEDLGLIAVTGAQLGEVSVAADASCSEGVEVCIVETSLDWSSAALPWKDALLFETFVDGERFSTSASLAVPNELGGLYSGREHDVVYVTLGDTPENARIGRQLERGEHSVEIRAHLPGSTQTLTTPAVTVVLSCGSSDEPALAENKVDGDSDGCSVGAGIGSSERHRVGVLGLAVLGLLLMAAGRRKRRASC